MFQLGIIGSQDVDAHDWLADATDVKIDLPGATVVAVTGSMHGRSVAVIPRNGTGRPLPPHAIDYRSNVLAMRELGVGRIVTTSLAGSLRADLPVGSLLLLDQFIDFTHDRQFTLFTDDGEFGFADMTEPFCGELRARLSSAAAGTAADVLPSGCYVGVPGPRFETRAEVRMFGMLGGDVVGHTTVSDCVMAREAEICCATVAGVITMGAGVGEDHTMNAHDWHDARRDCARRIRTMLERLLADLDDTSERERGCRCAVATPIER